MEVKFKILKVLICIIILAEVNLAHAFPTDDVNNFNKSDPKAPSQKEALEDNTSTAPEVQPSIAQNDTNPTLETDLEASESEHNEHNLLGVTESVESLDNEAVSSNFNPSIYGGLITPDAFQQYVNQFSTAFPYSAPYPAPVYTGYMPPPPPPVYPSPYVVQTGYEGYLVPTTTNSKTLDSAGDATNTNPPTHSSHPIAVFNNIVSTLMISTVFKIIAGIVSALSIVFLSGTFINFICNYTPLCDMSFRAVTYLRRKDNAEHMGQMISEGMTSERVKRASEFVQNAIELYDYLQKTKSINEHKM